MQLRDWRDALERLNILIEGVSDSNPLLAVPLVMLRVEARAALLEELKGEFDAEGDLLLEDIEWLEQVVEDKRTLNGLCHKAAGVYRRQGKVEQASIELFKAIELEPSDMKALLQYGECWRDLGKSVEELQQIVETAHDRIDRMVVNQMMNEEEARLWQDAFNSLL
jgi:tetratricopeptide (TPR) repeat protein